MSFIPSDGSVSGYLLRCEWHREQFLDFLKENRHPEGARGIVAWLFRSATSVGIQDVYIQQILAEADAARPELRLLQIARSLTADEIAVATRTPEFEIGQRGSVVLNARNLTSHRARFATAFGTIRTSSARMANASRNGITGRIFEQIPTRKAPSLEGFRLGC